MKTKRNILIISILLISKFAISQTIDDKIFTAEIELKNNNFAKAAMLFSEINDKQKSNEVLQKQALAFYYSGNYIKAIGDFETLLNRNSSLSSIYLSKCYALLNEKEKSLEFLKLHLQNSNKESEATIKMDTAFNNLKNDKEWEKLWLKDWYSTKEIELAEANYYFKNNRNIEALENLDAFLSINTDSHEAYYLRASVFFKLEDYKNASKDVKNAVELKKNEEKYLFLQAEIAKELKKYKIALDNYIILLKIDKYNFDYYIKRAETYSLMENYTAAIEDINHCLKYNSENSLLKNAKARYQINSGETWDALITINQLIAKEPTNPDYLVTRGLLYTKTSNTNSAFKDFTQALDYNPNIGEAYFQLAQLSLKEKNIENACFYLKTAIKLGVSKANEAFEKNCQE